MIKEIKSKENQKIKYATSLKMSKYRHLYKEFLAEGRKSLALALQAGVVKEIFTTEIIADIKEDITQYLINDDLLKKISFTKNPEGIVFICEMKERKCPRLNKIIYLDQINDPGNMGTIIRTALAFDYDAVVVSSGCCDVFNEKVVAASKGAIFLMPILYEPLQTIKKDKTLIVSSLDNKAEKLEDLHVEEPFILALGNEAHGVSKETILLADKLVKIAIDNIDSLNVSIAAGILMHHFK